MPRVTVVTSTYNYAPVLPYAIGSVLDQTFTDFELLVVGDGCTDESDDVVAAIDDERVHWHNLPENTGHQSGPNNEGIRRARGDVIAYLGHDDLWLPRHLEHLVDAIDRGATVAHGSTLWVEPSGRPDVRPTVQFANDPTTALSPTTFAPPARSRWPQADGGCRATPATSTPSSISSNGWSRSHDRHSGCPA